MKKSVTSDMQSAVERHYITFPSEKNGNSEGYDLAGCSNLGLIWSPAVGCECSLYGFQKEALLNITGRLFLFF